MLTKLIEKLFIPSYVKTAPDCQTSKVIWLTTFLAQEKPIFVQLFV